MASSSSHSPPHCSHKLQPLDRSVYGPLKRLVYNCCDGWMKAHPGATMSIYDLPGIVKSALPHAASPGNIQARFACTGIWRFNRNIFTDSDFAPSLVTDHPMPAVTPEVPSSSTTPSPNVATVASSMPLRASSPVTPCVVSKPEPEPSSSAMDTTFSPVSIRPHPKAGPRKQTTKGRKRRETAVLTDTPVKKQREAEKSRSAAKRKMNFNYNKKSKLKKQKTQDSSDDENEFCIVCLESFSRSREAWAHKDCTDGRDFYTCHNCDSDKAYRAPHPLSLCF
ncbi:histone-lysine N-methyltransferase PRDM9-like isoform X1 [Tachysurus ichikawai]